MRLRIFSFFAVLPIAAVLLSSCNEVNRIDSDADSFADRNVLSMTGDINVSLAEAKGIADRFVHSDAGTSLLPTKSRDSHSNLICSYATIREDGQDLMYVFNYEGGGFVIVGSTRNYYPILAYSDKGSFELSDYMGPVDVWLDETKVCIKNSPSLDNATKAQMQQLWSRYDGTYTDPTQDHLASRRPQTRSTGEEACWERCEALQAQYGDLGWYFFPLSVVEDVFSDAGLSSYYADICYSASQNYSALNETVIGYQNPAINQYGPFLETHWHQNSPFNRLCPNNIPAGCAVIAAAQVMKKYEFPNNLSWGGVSFTWADIMVQADTSSSSKQPYLIRLLGQKFQVDYDHGDSGAYPSNVKKGLDSLGYHADCVGHNYLTVRDELVNHSRPVIMYGVDYVNELNDNDDEVHMWVCDGARDHMFNQIRFYTENQPNGAGIFTQGMYSFSSPGLIGNVLPRLTYYHMNWGWDGNLDAWFSQNNVNSGNGNFQYERLNIYVCL